MKIRKLTTSLLILTLVLSMFSIGNIASAKYQGRKIVIFNSAINESARQALVDSVGGVVEKDLPLIEGKAVLLPNKAAERALEGRVGINRVDDDVVVNALGKPAPVQPVETTEWNITKISADAAWPTSKGSLYQDGINVAVIDTGIDKDHPDLVSNIAGGVNYVLKKGTVNPNNWDDDNGHGSHVAGIIAAADNSIGVVGVAPEADLYAVKVLNRNGSGYLSDVIAGINWAVSHDMDVINMSLGTDSDIGSLEIAVDAAYSAGVVVVAAAGNDGSDVDYPGAYSSVIATAATDINNDRPYWSSVGPQVELSAPGVSIRSTWKGNGYNTISGTSMASPHVAGTAALVLAAPILPGYDANSNLVWDASEVRQVLTDKADDLGAAGFDNYYGFGLVDAEESVTGSQTIP